MVSDPLLKIRKENTDIFRRQSEVNCLIRTTGSHCTVKDRMTFQGKKNDKKTFAQSALRILQKRPYMHDKMKEQATNQKGVNALQAHQIPFFHAFTRRINRFCGKRESGLVNCLHYFQFYYTISELQLKHTINSLPFKWLIKKEWTSGAFGGVRAHLSHPPSPYGPDLPIHSIHKQFNDIFNYTLSIIKSY